MPLASAGLELQEKPLEKDTPIAGRIVRHRTEHLRPAAFGHRDDLLITIDSMPAHLAGALGTPVWTLLSTDADWRWMVQRDDSPWYPTMRLFRQASAGHWQPVIARVRRQLQEFLAY